MSNGRTDMNTTLRLSLWASLALVCLSLSAPVQAQQSAMTFFITSAGPGKGADLGGLEGADRHCQSLAQAAGAGGHTWRAYLSTQAPALNDPKFVNARDRIGTGPWHNGKGVLVAKSVEDLHSAGN